MNIDIVIYGIMKDRILWPLYNICWAVQTMRYELRQTSASDREWVYQLNVRCYETLVVAQFGKWDDDWQREHFAEKWDPSAYEIVVFEGRDVGILFAAVEEDHVFLREIQIAPEFQNRGMGTAILIDLIDQAHRKGLPLRLRALHRNRATRLYERLGFSQTGRTETHVLMERAPNHTLHWTRADRGVPRQ